MLSKYLSLHFNKNVLVLIDEYDAPINNLFKKLYVDNKYPTHEDDKFFNEIVDLFKSCLSPLLKSNKYVEYAVIVGVLECAKESMLSGLNNVI